MTEGSGASQPFLGLGGRLGRRPGSARAFQARAEACVCMPAGTAGRLDEQARWACERSGQGSFDAALT
eukprot:NODE_4125_length_839_cov_8.883544_g3413_i0.p5 GENE.NODE_4125_length_839_cov_8.883544_g3413_i0~~NODE_4125_length_839_cov_8.883544_g3413_i0.p5  ORF type:complete len:68 (+),score=0.24 NODE_4125_length_839_cov_8.883544_g3413_i0:385-588(+)